MTQMGVVTSSGRGQIGISREIRKKLNIVAGRAWSMTEEVKGMAALAGVLMFLALFLPVSVFNALASQAEVGLDLEWRPIEGPDEKPAPKPGDNEKPGEQRGSEPEGRPAGRPGEVKTFTANGVSFKMIRMPAGEFPMGSSSGEPGRENDEIQHRVRITKDYWLGETEVTQELWKAVMGSNPSHFSKCGEDCPAENVSWHDCVEFINKINGIVSGGGFRLPTEAEWEYACRSKGRSERYCGGNDPEANGWFEKNSGGKTHPVKRKKPNAMGFYDMSGNVWEWCSDWYGEYPEGLAIDPKGPDAGGGKVNRGGAYHNGAGFLRAANRDGDNPSVRSDRIGLRLARTD
ncbi:MAG: formylglycine-generating enzyme family protein [Desulfobacteraceae bacterium]|nr:MAG: formylglycine-generating enzyme family protein [Desulfobacteraceae bacterium]